MTIIGFDISKKELIGVRINKTSRQQESYAIENKKEVIAALLDTLSVRHQKILVASEATAEYHRTLALECIMRNIPFRLLNPITTKQFTRATVRKKKTDLSDALVIAKLALQGEGTLINKESFNTLKPIIRTSMKLTRIVQMLHLMHSRFAQILPHETTLQNYLLAPQKVLETSIHEMRKRVLNDTDPKLRNLLCSIPGIGPTIASTLIAEIGTIQQFPSGKALVAYAGLDPKVRQSGMTLARNTRLTKRGSPYLRRVMYIAASIAVRHDQELEQYYEKKRKEGKRYKEAVVATARKLLYRVYAVWKRETPYVRYPQENLT